MKGFSRCTSCDNEPDELCDTCGRVRCNDCLSRCCERTCCEKADITFTCGRCQKEICEECARYCDVCDDAEDNLGCCDACLTCRTCPKCDAIETFCCRGAATNTSSGYCFPEDYEGCRWCTLKKTVKKRFREEANDDADARVVVVIGEEEKDTGITAPAACGGRGKEEE